MNAIQRFKPGVAHSSVNGAERAHFVPDALCVWLSPVVAQPPGYIEQDRDIVASARRRFQRFSHSLNAALAVRHRAFALAPGGSGRQHNVRKLAGLRQEHVLRNYEFQPFQEVTCVILVGFRLERVLADNI